MDGEGIADDDRPELVVTLALGSSVGGGTPVAPHARADDGQVEVVVAHGVGPLARVRFALDLRKGRHVEREDVTLTSGREVVVRADRDQDAFRVNTDGEVEEERVMSRSWRLLDQSCGSTRSRPTARAEPRRRPRPPLPQVPGTARGSAYPKSSPSASALRSLP